MLYWVLKHIFLGPLLKLWCRPKIKGREYIPETGAAILVSNHLAVADSFFMPLKLSRRVTFLAKREYFTGKGLKGALKRYFFSGIGQVPIDRSSGAAAQAALDTGVRLLGEGRLLGVYPEGTRSPDGRLYKGKTGVARMALEANVPVIPIAMVGTERVNPIGSTVWRPYRVKVKVGKPLDFSRYEGLAGDRFVERSITDEIMYALMELSGQEYVDVYAAKAKDDLETRGRVVTKRADSSVEQEADRFPDAKAG
ncbi:1-acyl-sn-glycerol-3-phosphate acyltransferase [Halopolyspora algeriensis]|uniref:1-acyl-sn-glycerol-3-phosphate acyltransferase n=1 Tax=Halopolyspora algeriensis TaxID=1500506 RepID=A0A368VR12_9ACTN|nr:lysophospholipid acyltransferase family protein [Halopolyspora algeriensis]RCW44044.1 1-acyl-sn-glycerol-3-phosphate acyltransferase [Halopolyspora algeriensis]TQM53457.1 1-acyl-sn-glycerol-3-phosphate acyltransferase [Halopolyspora algeriensis]